jgi:hypothetical protein
MGCGLGEIAGDALGTGLTLSNTLTILLALVLGVVGGFGLGIVPWRRQGLPFGQAARRVLITEGLSIGVMEAAEVLVGNGSIKKAPSVEEAKIVLSYSD